MNEQLRYSERIEHYFEGELDEIAMRDLESEMDSNPRLAFEFKLEKDLNDALEDTEVLDFRATLIEAQEDFKKDQSGKGVIRPLTRKYWYAAASVIILLIVAGSILLLKPSGYSNEKLYAMYYDSGESISITRAGGANVVEALLQFQNKNFAEASVLFTELMKNDPDNIALKYYSGISNMEIKDYSESVSLFGDIIKEGNTLYKDNAEWYLGLSYLVTDKTEKAREQFEMIAENEDHDFNKDAKSILQKMAKNSSDTNFLNKILFFVLPF